MDKKELTREEQLAIEEKAIESLLQMGVSFSVPLKDSDALPEKKRLFRKNRFQEPIFPKGWTVEKTEIASLQSDKIEEVYMRKFHVKPLFLGTIDYLRKLFIQVEFDEVTLQENAISESQNLYRYISIMAEIASVAIINDKRIIEQRKEVEELKEFLVEHLTVARMQKLFVTIAQMMNPSGFTNSIRLIQGLGMTRPKAGPIE